MCPQTREVQCLLQSMNNSPVKIKSNFQKKRPTAYGVRGTIGLFERKSAVYKPISTFFRWPTNSVTVGKVMIFFSASMAVFFG